MRARARARALSFPVQKDKGESAPDAAWLSDLQQGQADPRSSSSCWCTSFLRLAPDLLPDGADPPGEPGSRRRYNQLKAN